MATVTVAAALLFSAVGATSDPPSCLGKAVKAYTAPDNGDIWASRGWVVSAARNDGLLHAQDLESKRVVWLEAGAVVGPARPVRFAERIDEGFLVGGYRRPAEIDGEKVDALDAAVLRLNDDGKVVESYRTALLRQDGKWLNKRHFSINDALELPDGRFVVLWSGPRDRTDELQVGLSLTDQNLNHVRDVYGPKSLGHRWLGHNVDLRRSRTQVHVIGKRLVVVDALTNHLAIGDLSAESMETVQIVDPTGRRRPVVIAGWSLEPGKVYVQVGLPREIGQEDNATDRFLLAFDMEGELLSKRQLANGEMSTMILPTDSGKTMAVSGKDVYLGELVVD